MCCLQLALVPAGWLDRFKKTKTKKTPNGIAPWWKLFVWGQGSTKRGSVGQADGQGWGRSSALSAKHNLSSCRIPTHSHSLRPQRAHSERWAVVKAVHPNMNEIIVYYITTVKHVQGYCRFSTDCGLCEWQVSVRPNKQKNKNSSRQTQTPTNHNSGVCGVPQELTESGHWCGTPLFKCQKVSRLWETSSIFTRSQRLRPSVFARATVSPLLRAQRQIQTKQKQTSSLLSTNDWSQGTSIWATPVHLELQFYFANIITYIFWFFFILFWAK